MSASGKDVVSADHRDVPSRKKLRLYALLPTIYAVAALVAIVLTWLFLNRPASLPVKTVTIGGPTWAGFVIGVVGTGKGFFEGITVQYNVLDDPDARHAAFRSGRLDVLASSADVFVQEWGSGIRGAIILVTDESAGGDGVLAVQKIRAPKDLRGARIAFARATPSHFFLDRILSTAGLTWKDVRAVVVQDPGQAGQAFVGGSVEAAVTFEPFLGEVAQQRKDAHVLTTTREYPGLILDVLVGSETFVREPLSLRAFISGWMKAAAYVEANQRESVGLMAKALNVPGEAVQGMLDSIRVGNLALNQRYLVTRTGGKTHAERVMQQAAELWRSQRVIDKSPADDEALVSPAATEYLRDLVSVKPKG